MPNISIILPVCNGEKHSRKCLDSVLAETHSDFELIDWDDVSSDDSCKIPHSYRDSWIKFMQLSSAALTARPAEGSR